MKANGKKVEAQKEITIKFVKNNRKEDYEIFYASNMDVDWKNERLSKIEIVDNYKLK